MQAFCKNDWDLKAVIIRNQLDLAKYNFFKKEIYSV